MRALSELNTPSSMEEDEIDLKEIWNVIVRRRSLIASVAGVVFLHEKFNYISAIATIIILLGIWGVQKLSPKAKDEYIQPVS